MAEIFSTADIARLLNVPTWKVRRLFEEGTLADPARIGNQRAIPREMIPEIIAALEARGWMPVSQAYQPLCTRSAAR